MSREKFYHEKRRSADIGGPVSMVSTFLCSAVAILLYPKEGFIFEFLFWIFLGCAMLSAVSAYTCAHDGETADHYDDLV
jgi:hypothetical protein